MFLRNNGAVMIVYPVKRSKETIIYNLDVTYTVTYSTETQPISKTNEKKLLVFKRKILRKTFRAIKYRRNHQKKNVIKKMHIKKLRTFVTMTNESSTILLKYFLVCFLRWYKTAYNKKNIQQIKKNIRKMLGLIQ